MAAVGICPPEWHVDRNGPVAILRLSGDWIACETGVRTQFDATQVLAQAGDCELRFDGRNLGRWDSALIAFLKTLQQPSTGARAQATTADQTGLPDSVRRLLALAGSDAAIHTANEPPPPSLPARVGEAFFDTSSGAVEVAGLVGETALRGAAAIAARTHTRASDILQLVREAGPSALLIVAIMNGLVGAILAFVSAVQLQRLGAGIYVADLVGIAVVRELAAIGTAMVMAGRTGGAYAAHLATMLGNEEIDALQVLGVRIFDFLVLPRVAALVAMMPLLYFYGCALGILGGFIASVATLDITPALFLRELHGGIALKHFAIGLSKSVVFGALVALASCHIGLKAGRSAADVGHAATSAVVAGIIGIIAIDTLFAVCANALGV